MYGCLLASPIRKFRYRSAAAVRHCPGPSIQMGVDSDIKSQAVIDGAQNINIVSLRLSHTDTRR